MAKYNVIRLTFQRLNNEQRDALIRFALTSLYEGGIEGIDLRKSDEHQVQMLLDMIEEI